MTDQISQIPQAPQAATGIQFQVALPAGGVATVQVPLTLTPQDVLVIEFALMQLLDQLGAQKNTGLVVARSMPPVS